MLQIPESISMTPTTPRYKLIFWLIKQFLKSPQQQASIVLSAFALYVTYEVRSYFLWRQHLRSVLCHSDRSELAAGCRDRLLTILKQTDPIIHPNGAALRCSAESFQVYLRESAARNGRQSAASELSWMHFYSCVLCFFGLSHERNLSDDTTSLLLGIVDNFTRQEGLARPPSVDPTVVRRLLGANSLIPSNLPAPVVAYGQCPIKASYKPLPVRWAFSAALSALDIVARLGLGYSRHWVAIPEGYISFLVRRPSMKQLKRRSSASSTYLPPLLFIHGIGLGALPHIFFFEAFKDRTLVLVELPNSGHWHYQQENASPASLRSAVCELFTRLELGVVDKKASTSSLGEGASSMRKVPSVGSLTSNTGSTSVEQQQCQLETLQRDYQESEKKCQKDQGQQDTLRSSKFCFDAIAHSLGTDFLSMGFVMEEHASYRLQVRRMVLLDPICFPVEMLASHRAPFWSLDELREKMPWLPWPIAWAVLHWIIRDVNTQQACFRTLNSDACLVATRIPTLVGLGGRDVVVPAYDIERYLRYHQPEFEVHMEHQAGHGDFLEHPNSHPRVRRLIHRLKKFLAKDNAEYDMEGSVKSTDETAKDALRVIAK